MKISILFTEINLHDYFMLLPSYNKINDNINIYSNFTQSIGIIVINIDKNTNIRQDTYYIEKLFIIEKCYVYLKTLNWKIIYDIDSVWGHHKELICNITKEENDEIFSKTYFNYTTNEPKEKMEIIIHIMNGCLQ